MKRVTVIVNEVNDHHRRIKEAVSLVNGAQNYFMLSLSDSQMEVTCTNDKIDAESTRLQVTKLYPNNHVILVVTHPFTDNWFSHPHRDCQIITIADWEQVFAPPSLCAFLTYHFVEALLTFGEKQTTINEH